MHPNLRRHQLVQQGAEEIFEESSLSLHHLNFPR